MVNTNIAYHKHIFLEWFQDIGELYFVSHRAHSEASWWICRILT